MPLHRLHGIVEAIRAADATPGAVIPAPPSGPLFELGEIFLPPLVRVARVRARPALLLGTAQLDAPNLARDRLRQLRELDPPHALVGRKPLPTKRQVG